MYSQQCLSNDHSLFAWLLFDGMETCGRRGISFPPATRLMTLRSENPVYGSSPVIVSCYRQIQPCEKPMCKGILNAPVLSTRRVRTFHIHSKVFETSEHIPCQAHTHLLKNYLFLIPLIAPVPKKIIFSIGGTLQEEVPTVQRREMLCFSVVVVNCRVVSCKMAFPKSVSKGTPSSEISTFACADWLRDLFQPGTIHSLL